MPVGYTVISVQERTQTSPEYRYGGAFRVSYNREKDLSFKGWSQYTLFVRLGMISFSSGGELERRVRSGAGS